MRRSYLCDREGNVESGLTVDRLRQALGNEQSLLWVDIEDPQDADIEVLLEVFELHALTVEDCIMPNVRPKLEDFERYLFIILQGLRRGENQKLQSVELDVILGKNFLITVRSERIRSLDEVCARVERKSPIIKRGPDFLFYAITEALIDSYFPFLDEVEAKVDVMETRMLSGSTEDTVRELLGIYHEITTLRRTLAPHRDILNQLNRGELPFIQPRHHIYFRDIYDHLMRMSDLVDSAREVTTLSLEAHATIVSNRLNEIMKTMTAFATLALPLIIVTGIFGMNFGEHPELGPRMIYQVFSLLMLASMPVMLYYFRKYKWL